MKRGLICAFILLILIQLCSAYTYLNIYLDETGEALFLGETNEELDLPKGIEIEKSTIKGTTQELTSKSGETWKFSYSLKGAELYVVLPKGAVIKNIDGGEISLDKDKFAVYTQDSIEVEYTIEDYTGNDIWFFIITIVLISLIIFYVIRKKKIRPKKEGKTDKTKIIEGLLNDREKLIIDELKKTDKIKSSQLRKICDIPKASFSRHIQELEKKNLIKREGESKNKIVSLR